MQRVAFVVGATGSIGKELVRELVSSTHYSQVRTLTRRQIEYPWLQSLDASVQSKLQQHVGDFENLTASREIFDGCTAGFCCLGTTRKKAGSAEAFRHVDFDYVLETAQLAHAAQVPFFHLVTSVGSDAHSSFLYPRVKGEIEEAVKRLNFRHLYIYRPSTLIAEREESRWLESLSRPFMYLLGASYKPIDVKDVAKAMVYVDTTLAPQVPDAAAATATATAAATAAPGEDEQQQKQPPPPSSFTIFENARLHQMLADEIAAETPATSSTTSAT